MSTVKASLKPRKSAVQARSAATVEALHEATLQVLTQQGLVRCTTTRVAERAGMSVGSLYQYYPNRDALLAAILEKHLVRVADSVELACSGLQGASVAEMAGGLVKALLTAKLREQAVSKALYAIAEPNAAGRSWSHVSTCAWWARLQPCWQRRPTPTLTTQAWSRRSR
jgi:Transcriptional regulator